jgi:hypothetical protein
VEVYLQEPTPLRININECSKHNVGFI